MTLNLKNTKVSLLGVLRLPSCVFASFTRVANCDSRYPCSNRVTWYQSELVVGLGSLAQSGYGYVHLAGEDREVYRLFDDVILDYLDKLWNDDQT